MINEDVINEIYKKYSKPIKDESELGLAYFADILNPHNPIKYNDMEVEIEKLDEFNPFKRFLIRSLNGVVEFDKRVAFVFKNHIIFLNSDSDQMYIHLKPESKSNIFSRIFGK